MAEVLGVIASAVQIADTSLKLRKLWTGIKEMPDTVRDMIDDVELLANTLAQIQSVPIPSFAAQLGNVAWKECHRTLETVSTSFQGFVNDLDRHMTAHKKTGSMRAFLKRQKMVEWQDRLSRLKMTMVLAQQAYTQALFTQQCSTIISTLQAIAPPSQGAPPTSNSMALTHTIPGSGNVSTGSALSITRVADSSPSKNARQSHQRRYTIQFPRWILSKGVQLLLSRSYGSWTMNLRVYNLVSANSEVFQAAWQRDWRYLQVLFDGGKASPFDVNEYGRSLMHVAAYFTDADGCRFLLDCGLEANPLRSEWLSPLEYMALDFIQHEQETAKAVEVARLLGSSFEDYDLRTERDFIGFYEFPKEVVRHLTTSASGGYEMIEPLLRAKSLCVYRGPDPEAIPFILGPDLPLSKAFELLLSDPLRTLDQNVRNHRDLVERLAFQITFLMSDERAIQVLAERWRPVVTEVILFEHRLKDVRLRFASPVVTLLHQFLSMPQTSLMMHQHGSVWSQKLTSAVRVWIQFLRDMGIDLNNYAKAEKQYFVARHNYSCHHFHLKFRIRVTALTCGPNVDDWSLYAVMAGHDDELSHAEYEMAGSFWAWVENPELFMIPGAYPNVFDEDWDSSNCLIAGPIF